MQAVMGPSRSESLVDELHKERGFREFRVVRGRGGLRSNVSLSRLTSWALMAFRSLTVFGGFGFRV